MTKGEVIEKFCRDLETRGRSPATIYNYKNIIRDFQNYHDRPADQMREPEIAAYQHYLLMERKVKTSTVNCQNSAIRVLYGMTLGVLLNHKQIPQVKRIRTLPKLLTREEIKLVIENAPTLESKAVIMLAYGSGLRLFEIAGLKVSDIDSKNMRIFVSQGKGHRDRFALLPQTTLNVLRQHWLEKPGGSYLFFNPDTGEAFHKRTIYEGYRRALIKSKIRNQAPFHTLRHCFATHLIDEGYDLFTIKKLMGHSRIDTTAWYVQLADSQVLRARSPLESLMTHE